MNEHSGMVVRLGHHPQDIGGYTPQDLKRALQAVCQEAYIGMPEIAEALTQFDVKPQDFHQFWGNHIPMEAVEKAMARSAVLVSGVSNRISLLELVRMFPNHFAPLSPVVLSSPVVRAAASLEGWFLASEGEFAREPGLYRYLPESNAWRIIGALAPAAYVLLVMGNMRTPYPSNKRVAVEVVPYPGHTERFAFWFDDRRIIHCEARFRPPIRAYGR